MEIISDRRPTDADADKNGDVFGYINKYDFVPVPFRSVRFGLFKGWRPILKNDYKNQP